MGISGLSIPDDMAYKNLDKAIAILWQKDEATIRQVIHTSLNIDIIYMSIQ
ncbi:MAG: hypothetical protein NW207_09815 [Cytophagales bacterium]|nr:hypothetical protein [Cytophagales bacterium]